MRACRKAPDAIPAGAYVASLSITYNIGNGAFCKSTLARTLNAGDIIGAYEFPKWDKAAGIRLPGLTNRRARSLPKRDSDLISVFFIWLLRTIGIGGVAFLGLFIYDWGIPGASRIPYLSSIPIIDDLSPGRAHSFAADQVKIATAQQTASCNGRIEKLLSSAELVSTTPSTKCGISASVINS